ncbi:LamG-like jellyroll fold domain-containing protein [Streptomyces sp. NPDC092952]|uniref:LamG-like jellyroll fold domain-containing protein n=1 Tax=Streptomyces sp. NPDC092952 TaxID=3366018 RepID=UPI00380ADF84
MMNATTGRRRSGPGRLRAAAAALALLAGALSTAASVTSPASALTAPVALTADDLSTWQTNGIVWAMAGTSDGVVYTGGTFSTVRPPGAAAGTSEQPALNFAAFDAATGEPTGCQLSFTLSSGTATVRALALSPDQKTLYVGGQFGSVSGVGVSNIAAIDTATCTPRQDFKLAVSATVRALTVTADTVYLGGDFNSVAGQTRNKFAAVTTAAALKPWKANTDEVGRAVELTPDGKHVLLGGDFFTVNGTTSHALAVVDATTGAVAKSYPAGFIPDASVVKDLATDATGFYTANEGTGGGVFDGRIALDLSTFAQRWRDTCLGATQAVLVHKGVLYSGSHAHDCATMGEFPNQPRKHLLAQSVTDPKLLPWFPDTNDGIGEPVGPRVMAQADKDGHHYLWVGGEFTTVNGTAQQGLTRFADGPDTGAPWVPNVGVSTVAAGKVEVNWQASYDTDDGTLTYRIYRDGGTTPVYTTTGYSVFWDRPQLRWTDTDVAPGETHTYRITASDGTNTSAKSPAVSATVASAAAKYPARVLSDGASLYWRYDDPSTFVGDTGAGRDNGFARNSPTRQSVPAAVAGPSTALGLNGTSQYVYSNKRHPQPTKFSVETWFRTTTTKGGRIVGFSNLTMQNSTQYDKHIYMRDDGKLVFGVKSGSARTITTPAAYNNGAWHHVVATQGTGGMALYVDGVLRASTTQYTGNEKYDGYWRVGGDNLNGWPSKPSSTFFAGQVDETAVYPTALTSAQISAHYALRTSG